VERAGEAVEQLDLVDFAVAAHQRRDEPLLGVVEQGLDDPPGVDAEKGGDLFDGLLLRRVDLP
jgi:hypothetical protein